MKKTVLGKKMKRIIRSLMAYGVMVVAGIGVGASPAGAAASDYPTVDEVIVELASQPGTTFPVGSPNVNYEKYFTGKTYIAGMASGSEMGVANVTFIDGAHTYWHIHHGSCQILVTEAGSGYYQIWGQKPQKLIPGKAVTIPEGVKHWHGAAPGSYMQHISIMRAKPDVTTEWLEPVNQKDFDALK